MAKCVRIETTKTVSEREKELVHELYLEFRGWRMSPEAALIVARCQVRSIVLSGRILRA